MTRNTIFLGVLGLIVAAAAVSSWMSDDPSYEDSWQLAGENDLVIESDSREIVVHSGDAEINCKTNGGSVTIERPSGKKITITCDE
ncbi:hypothetical protein [Kordiimonas sp.]|uniref:hypothetical protein n=1 Tax=Kordiimonas sp. TaxID=1970157 RepID=UPI003A8DEF6F